MSLLIGPAVTPFDKSNYPAALVERPQVLPPGMVGVQIGFMSDIVGQNAQQTRPQLNLAYAPAKRTQVGVDADIFTTPEASLNEAAIWAEYSVSAGINVKIGAYGQTPAAPTPSTGDPASSETGASDSATPSPDATDQADLLAGLRISVPMKLKVSEHIALLAAPRFGTELNGTKEQKLELPIGIQFQAGPKLAAYANIDASFLGGGLKIPLKAGLLYSIKQTIDLGADLRMNNSTDASGRDKRWLLVYLTLRK